MQQLIYWIKTKINQARKINRRRNYLTKKIKHYCKLSFAMMRWDQRIKKPLNLNGAKTVLLLRNEGQIGDVIIDTALIKALHNSGYSIDFLLTDSNKQIIQYNPYIRNIFSVALPQNDDFIKKLTHNIPKEIISQLHQQQYDLVIDHSLFYPPIHRMQLFNQIQAKNIIGFNKWKRINHYNHVFDFNCDNQHIRHSYHPLAKLLQLNESDLQSYDLHYPQNTEEEVKNFLASFPAENKNVLINIFAGNADRSLSEQQLAAIANAIKSQYPKTNLIVLDHKQVINMALLTDVIKNPFSTLHHTIALIALADLVISPDTAIVHMAAAWQKPLIAFYQNIKSNNNLWAPGYPKAEQVILPIGRLHQNKHIEHNVIRLIQKNHWL